MSISANDLLCQHPQEVQAWLDRVLAGRQAVPTNFNWLGLPEGLAFEATNPVDDREPADQIATAQTPIAVYDHLAHTLDPDGRDSYEHSAMMLRAAMIAQLGEAASHPVLGLGPVRNWFFERLTLSCDEALAMAADWTKQPSTPYASFAASRTACRFSSSWRMQGILEMTKKSRSGSKYRTVFLDRQ